MERRIADALEAGYIYILTIRIAIVKALTSYLTSAAIIITIIPKDLVGYGVVTATINFANCDIEIHAGVDAFSQQIQ